MRTIGGQSLHQLECEACDEIDRLFNALKRLQSIALDTFEASGEQAEAIEQAIFALATAGDPDAISANAEWEREKERLGLST